MHQKTATNTGPRFLRPSARQQMKKPTREKRATAKRRVRDTRPDQVRTLGVIRNLGSQGTDQEPDVACTVKRSTEEEMEGGFSTPGDVKKKEGSHHRQSRALTHEPNTALQRKRKVEINAWEVGQEVVDHVAAHRGRCWRQEECVAVQCDRSAETLALRLMGEIRAEWSFAKSEKHTTHTQHTLNTHNVRSVVLFHKKDDFLSLLDAVRDPETKRNCFKSKDFNSRKVKVLISKSYITRAETVNRNRFITPSRGFSRVLDTIRLLKNLPVKVNHSNKRDSDPLASLELLQALYTVQRY
ncbi:hypothetical protein C8R45DRAFT_939651 [Mycena sanguinolenta]|nr:hypothetical protein C8R45DRAFT_939651 [Mycena sanguinolenta]